MADERQVLEMNARAIAILHFYRDRARSPRAQALIASEMRDVVRWFVDAKLGRAGIEARVLEPVEVELVDRYGPWEAARLNAEFLKAFGAQARARPLPSLAKV